MPTICETDILSCSAKTLIMLAVTGSKQAITEARNGDTFNNALVYNKYGMTVESDDIPII